MLTRPGRSGPMLARREGSRPGEGALTQLRETVAAQRNQR
jgi:hypothetical protein